MKDATTGTETRPGRQLQAAVLGFRLDDEIAALRAEPGRDRFGRSAKTLAKAPGFRLVLSLVGEGGTVGEDDAHAPLAVLLVEGAATAARGTETIELEPGGLAWFGEGGGWAVRARRESALLLAVSWPEERATEATHA